MSIRLLQTLHRGYVDMNIMAAIKTWINSWYDSRGSIESSEYDKILGNLRNEILRSASQAPAENESAVMLMREQTSENFVLRVLIPREAGIEFAANLYDRIQEVLEGIGDQVDRDSVPGEEAGKKWDFEMPGEMGDKDRT